MKPDFFPRVLRVLLAVLLAVPVAVYSLLAFTVMLLPLAIALARHEELTEGRQRTNPAASEASMSIVKVIIRVILGPLLGWRRLIGLPPLELGPSSSSHEQHQL